MIVLELIDELETFDPTMLVVVSGYERGYENPVIKTTYVEVNAGKEYWWEGVHGEGGTTEVVLISR